ncbi:class I SAM-dependent methyltransferase [Streptomyces sp. KL2]|uniref:class I SAM-dependent methyltransferase n=1 Tax=Streptomyces sp. KL2 TaxID=3050126 RepID=UPI0039783F2F
MWRSCGRSGSPGGCCWTGGCPRPIRCSRPGRRTGRRGQEPGAGRASGSAPGRPRARAAGEHAAGRLREPVLRFRPGRPGQGGAADGSFDAVVTGFAVHHVRADRYEHAFAETFRVLRPGAACWWRTSAGPPGGTGRRSPRPASPAWPGDGNSPSPTGSRPPAPEAPGEVSQPR